MRGTVNAGLLALVALAGCVPVKPLATGTAPASTPAAVPRAPEANATPAAPPVASTSNAVVPTAPAEPPAPLQPTQVAPPVKPVPASIPSSATPAKAGTTSAGTAAAKATASSAPAQAAPAAPRPAAAPAPAAAASAATRPSAAPAPPAMDLNSLQQRLRDTRAIGVFTKLSLKNQVDDLLARFRSFYSGETKIPLSSLRQQYEMLFLKVVTVVQDGDPSLATAIATSREAIWGILADPKKFAQI
jgi:hypothetical protein